MDTQTPEPVNNQPENVQGNTLFVAPETNQPVPPQENAEGNVVFNPEQKEEGESQQTQMPSQSQLQSQPPAIPPAPPENQNPNPPAPLEEEKSGFPSLLKIGIIFIVVLVLGFILFAFVLSKLFSHKPEKVTLQWWGLWEDPGVIQTLINEFEKSNPNIMIQYTKEDPKQYSERLLTRIQFGNGPDIFRFHSSWMPMVQPYLTPLSSSAISNQDFSKNFYSVAQHDLVVNGAIYGIPLEVDTLALFTNNQLFQSIGFKPPTNWTDFITAARALTVKDANGNIKTAGAALGTFDNITHAPDIVSLLMFQNGADIFNLGNTKQNATDALIFYTSFAKNDGSNVWSSDLESSINAFAKGNLAMFLGYSYDVFNIKSLNQNLAFSVSPVPHLLGRDITVSSYWVEGISNKSKYQKEAMIFMNFLSRKETEQLLYTQEAKTRLFGEPYARTDLADLLKSDPLTYPFVSQAKNVSSSFFAGETYDTGLNAQMNGYLGNAVRSVLSNSSPQTAVDTLTQGVAQVLSQYAPKKQQ